MKVTKIYWSSVKEESLSIAYISTMFVKLFIDIYLEFDVNFSLSAQILRLIFSLKSRPAGIKLLNR
jgi:hypothetical protein